MQLFGEEEVGKRVVDGETVMVAYELRQPEKLRFPAVGWTVDDVEWSRV